MKLETFEAEDIVVEVRGAKFTFQPASHQDVIFADTTNDYLANDHAKISISRDKCITHVFSKLKAVEGLEVNGEKADADKVRGIALKIQTADLMPILLGWSIKVFEQHGIIKAAGSEEKNESTKS
ncbi:MAG: hypothetical protein E6Q97_21695 [Desulfurellales bacterium]|nr:MAG: hypothetical protein E6Q97_21695 [Desulfurellales bacterium]